jgi:SAM-dependent methyltransferase
MRVQVKKFESYEQYVEKQVGSSILTRLWPVYAERCRNAVTKFFPWWKINASVLDAGCGDGYTLDRIRAAGFCPTGADLDPGRVKTAREHGHRAEECDLANMPFANGEFDVVYNRHTLEHMLDPKAVLSEFIRVLKPGGQFSLIVPVVDENDWRSRHPHLVPGKAYVEWLVEGAGFKIERLAVYKPKEGAEIWVWATKGGVA